MTEEQIELLRQILKNGRRLAYQFGREYREIIKIGMRKEAYEDDSGLEPAGIFANGEYIALMACCPEDIVRFEVVPVFHIRRTDDLSGILGTAFGNCGE